MNRKALDSFSSSLYGDLRALFFRRDREKMLFCPKSKIEGKLAWIK